MARHHRHGGVVSRKDLVQPETELLGKERHVLGKSHRGDKDFGACAVEPVVAVSHPTALRHAG